MRPGRPTRRSGDPKARYTRPLTLGEAAIELEIDTVEVRWLIVAWAPVLPVPGARGRHGGGPRENTRLVPVYRGTRVTARSVDREGRRRRIMQEDGPHPSCGIPRAARQLGLTPAKIRRRLAPDIGRHPGATSLRRGYDYDRDVYDAPGVDIESLRREWEARLMPPPSARIAYRDRRAAWTRPDLPPWPRQEPGFRLWHNDPVDLW
jgi:hypothetical protein